MICPFYSESKEKYDVSGRATYVAACNDCGVIPASYYLRHMKETNLLMQHHGLGEKGARAISIALVVSTPDICFYKHQEDQRLSVVRKD